MTSASAEAAHIRITGAAFGPVTSVCAMLVGDRQLLASAGGDGTVRLWDPATGNPPQVLHGHGDWVTSVCAVPVGDRQLLASAGGDGMVLLWDPATDNPPQVLQGHTDWVTSVCAVPVGDRQLLAAAGGDGTVLLWDPATGNPPQVLQGHTGTVTSVCAVPVGDRQLLAAAGDDGTVLLWDPATGNPPQVLQGHTGTVTSVCAVPVGDRQLLAAAGDDGTVLLWDPATGNPPQVLQGHTGTVTSVCAVPVGDRQLLAAAGDDGTVLLWDPATDNPPQVLQGHTDTVTSMCAVPVGDRQLLASAGYDGTVRLWDPATDNPPQVLQGHTDWVNSMCAVPVGDRQLLASAGGDGTVRLWDPATGNPQQVLQGHTRGVTSVCAVPVGDRVLLASAGRDGTVLLWDPATDNPPQVLQGHTGTVASVCAVPVGDRQLLASAGYDGTVRLWDPATGNPPQVLRGDTGWVTSVCAVPVGDRVLLASAGGDGTVLLWDPATDNPPQVLQGHTDRVTSVCAVPVGDRVLLASAGGDGTVLLWDPATDNPPQVLQGHTDTVTSVCAVPVGDRQLLASAGGDGTVRLWDPASGAAVAVIPAHRGIPVTCVAASDAGIPRLFSGGSNGSVAVWSVAELIAVNPVGLDDVFTGENTGAADRLSRTGLAVHLAERLRQLTSSDRSPSPAAGDLTGSGIIHIDGRWGAGKTTLIEHMLRSQSSTLGDPVVVRYDAWRQAAIAPEWWSIASEVRRAVHASRALPVRVAMSGAEVARRLGRSTSTWVAVLIVVLAGLGGRWLVSEPSSVSAQFKAVLDLVTTLSALLAVGFVLARSVFWTAPVMARLHVRTDDNPLGEISGIVAQLRRWTPQVGVPRRLIDWVAFVWLTLTGALALGWRPAGQFWDHLAGDQRWLIGGTVLAAIATYGAVLLVRGTTRAHAKPEDTEAGESASGKRSGSSQPRNTPGPRAAQPPRGRREVLRRRARTVQRLWWRIAAAAVLIGVAVVAARPLWAQIDAVWQNLDTATRAWASLFLVGLAAYALVLAIAARRPRRMVLLIIDDIDRCAADRVVRLLEAVHTVLRERNAPRFWPRLRQPAPFGVIVLASGRWVRDAFTSQYSTFDTRASDASVHDLGADFLQKVFDHSVLVPALSPEQTEGLIHAVAGSRFYASESKPARALRTPASIPEVSDDLFKLSRDDAGRTDLTTAARPTSGPLTESPNTSAPDPREQGPRREDAPPPADEMRAESGRDTATKTSGTIPEAPDDEASAAAARSAKDDLGLNAQLLVTHLLTDYAEILPGNPRLIIRVASAWAMLRAVATSLELERDSALAKEILVRAAVTWVRFPVLVDELLDADSPPNIDPSNPDCLPRWRRPDVQQVLTMRNGQRIDIEDLALYYGTYFAPPLAPAIKAPPEPPLRNRRP